MAEILPSMTVREINLRYPACREVFNQYGMGGFGGTYGPPEPIDFFAQAHNVPLDDLIRALTDAAGRSSPGISESSDERANTALSRRFIKAALAITLTLGTAWGVVILTQIALGRSFGAPKLSLTQAHGHAYPNIRPVLVSSGLTHLAHLPKVPGFVTVGIAAKRHGLDVDSLVAKLNQTINHPA